MTAPSDFNSIPELDATLVFRVAYDGSSYSGFAEQPGQTTVAGELRRAIETLLRRPIDLTCAGRTDAGVHAVAQYISVPVSDAELACTRRRWLRAIDVYKRQVEDTVPQKTLHITLKYGPKKAKVINGIRRISKPGLRKYTGVADMPRVRGGLGTAIISTSHGVMTDRDARKHNVGGEIIAYVW